MTSIGDPSSDSAERPAGQRILKSLGPAPVWLPGDAWADVPGAQRPRAQIEGTLPPPPLELLVDMKMTGAERRRVEYRLEASPWLADEDGAVDPAAICYFADAPLAHAAQLSAERFRRLASMTISVDLVDRVPMQQLPLTATATPESDRADAAVAGVRISSRSALVAVGSTRALAKPYPEEQLTDPLPFGHRPVPPRLDPPNDSTESGTPLSGLDLVRSVAADDSLGPPFWRLLGVRVAQVSRGHATVEAQADPWLSGYGVIYGGALCAISVAALHACLRSADAIGERTRIFDVAYTFVRPVLPDGDLLTARAHVAHRGRTMSVADVELVDARSRTVGLGRATGLAVLDEPT